MFAGGAAAGVFLTPAPWRLVTDTALWSENWPGIPRPARGEIRARYTNCSLCPAGCAVRARCVSDQPVSLAGVPGHPLTHGALCPFGLAGHHLPYHPARLRQGPVKGAAAAVADGIAKCKTGERIAVLDLRPGRTASWTYRRAMAAMKNGVYLAPRHALGGSLAVNLAAARTVLSFGVPVLDGWGTPGNVIAAREGFRLIQVEAVESRTAAIADWWLRIPPGTEEDFARTLAQELAVPSGASGQIAALAKELKENGPSLVLGEPESVLDLNQALGSLGRTIVARRETPVPQDWNKAAPITNLDVVADCSIRVLLIDESTPGEYLPWTAIEPKLVRDNPVVVALSWSREGYGRHANYVLPTAVYPEAADDIPPAIDSVTATFRIAVPLLPPPPGVVRPEEWIAKAACLPLADTLRERADAIHKNGRGTIFTYADAKSTDVKQLTPDQFWKALNAGASWMDCRAGCKPADRLSIGPGERSSPAAVFPSTAGLPLVSVLSNTPAPSSPLLSKLYQESNLRLVPGRVALHPDTAHSSGLQNGAQAILQTAAGQCPVEVTLDATVPPEAVYISAHPALLDICAPGARAKVVRA